MDRFLVVAIVLAMLSPAQATNISIILSPIQPDIPILYDIKVKVLEPLDIALSGNKEAKRVEHAERRLQEALAMAQKGKFDKANEAIMRANLLRWDILIDVASASKSSQTKEFEKSVEATVAFEKYKHSIEVINTLLKSSSMPEQSKQGLSNALENLQGDVESNAKTMNRTASNLEKVLPTSLTKDIKAKHGR